MFVKLSVDLAVEGEDERRPRFPRIGEEDGCEKPTQMYRERNELRADMLPTAGCRLRGTRECDDAM